MKVKASVVCDNCVFHQPGVAAEHGLSILLETEAGNYLPDTGQGREVVNDAASYASACPTARRSGPPAGWPPSSGSGSFSAPGERGWRV